MISVTSFFVNKMPWQSLRYFTGVKQQLVQTKHLLSARRGGLMLPKGGFSYIVEDWTSCGRSARSWGLSKIPTKIRVILAKILCEAAGGTHADTQSRSVCNGRYPMTSSDNHAEPPGTGICRIWNVRTPLVVHFFEFSHALLSLPHSLHSSYIHINRTKNLD